MSRSESVFVSPGSRLALVILAASLSSCSSGYDDGLKKVPVRGTITIDGKPVAGLVVRLLGTTASEKSNAQFPVGVTDAQGAFQLSTNGTNDGAVAGEYNVTVMWPENNEPPMKDKLKGAYATPAKSKLKATIGNEETTLPPIELKTGK